MVYPAEGTIINTNINLLNIYTTKYYSLLDILKKMIDVKKHFSRHSPKGVIAILRFFFLF